jgi:hypothetical protein
MSVKDYTFMYVIKEEKQSNTVKLYNFKKPYTELCSICIDKLKTNVIETDCKHIFHKTCLESWIKEGSNTCPFCRAVVIDVEPKIVYVITDNGFFKKRIWYVKR